MSIRMANVELSSLMPSNATLLPYSLPLFFLSFILNFSGAFLTLDRTRSFVPTGDVAKANTTWITPFFHGGLGGIIVGYAFGLHLATFLSLLIPSLSDSKSLTSSSFIAVWILSSLFTAVIAGRWKYAALIAAGISGGSTLALSLSVIIHPSLLTRIVLVAVFFPLLTILTLLPFPRFQPIFVRIAMSSTGAFGLVLSIALMSHVSAWSNVWERLWISDSVEWGTSGEKGLSAGFCLFLLTGTACDWFLKSRFGENPDQKWDSYLAGYVANLPDGSDRAGSFQPLKTMWDSLFDHSSSPPIAPPPYDNIKNIEKSRTVDIENAPGTFKYEKEPAFLRKHKKRSNARPGKNRAIQFRPLDVDELSSSDSDSELDDAKLRNSPLVTHPRPWITSRPTLSSRATDSTAVDVDPKDSVEQEKAKLLAMRKSMYKLEAPEYSDHEEDVTVDARVSRDVPSWSPPFLKRHRDSHSGASTKGSHSSRDTLTTPPIGSVPVTPSLINALDRIAAAQDQAYGPSGSSHGSSTLHEGLPEMPTGGRRWDEFWKDVNDKAKLPPH